MNYIEIIQGDTYTAYLNITQNGTAIDSSLVGKIYVTCKDLDLQQEVVYENSKWKLTISSSTSANFIPGEYTYDLTIKWTDSTIITGKYEGDIVVLAKHNEVDYE